MSDSLPMACPSRRNSSDCSGSLASGATCKFFFYVDAWHHGAFHGSVGLLSSDPTSPLLVPITVTVTAPPPRPDTTAPVMGALSALVPRSATPGRHDGIDVVISWLASDNVAVAGYTVRYRPLGGAWTTVIDQQPPFGSTLDPVVSAKVRLHAGTYRVEARARDKAGNESTARTETQPIGYVDIDGHSTKLTGSWTTVRATGAHGSAVIESTSKAATSTLEATGTGYVLVARKSPTSGLALVYVDASSRAPSTCIRRRRPI